MTRRLGRSSGANSLRSSNRSLALRKLVLPDQIRSLQELKGPGFSLEALKGDRKGQHSIRINENWRICFIWTDLDAYRVEVTNYH